MITFMRKCVPSGSAARMPALGSVPILATILATIPATIIASILISTLACGGGGSSSGGAKTAPAITQQPASLTVDEGQPATFTVAATGGALSYRWQRNRVDLPGAGAASYTTPPTVIGDDQATFSVVVMGASEVKSADAVLTVRPATAAPVLTQQPQDQAILAGQKATFSVLATAPGSLSYQWRKNGSDLPGATGASYTTPAALLTDSGAAYSVVVASGGFKRASREAKLTVSATSLPAITFTVSPGAILAGMSSTLTWSVANATSVSIDQGIGTVAASGTRPITPAATTTFTLTASGPGGTATATATVALLSASANTLVLKEEEGQVSTNFPLQIGRPFLQGEIHDYPQVLVDGVAVATQADVKQRYPDGSVKHAILSFLVPALPAKGAVTLSFRNQGTGLNDQRLSAAAMLDAAFDFDARIELTQGAKLAASARQMLQDGKFTYWMEGPVATSIILADHSTARAYDLGFDSHKAFRPIFHATFWPALHKVHVRFIGEATHTEAMEDLSYDLALGLGSAAPRQIYAKAGMTHYALSRWTKDFWLGGAPGKVSLNHNLPYLAATRMLPNFDTRKVIPETELASRYATWQARPKDLYEAGWWTKGMATTGGRPDIGIYPTWTVQWLYTGDWRMAEIAFKQAELSGAWGVHVREGNPAKFLDKAHAVPGLGYPMSVSSRPTMKAGDWANIYIKAEDKCVVAGPMTNGGWTPDNSHVADFSTPQYLLTGDYWFLEEMYFWTAIEVANMIGYDTKAIWGRGPTGMEGGIYEQVRGQAWIFRNRIHTHSVAPDADPFKAWLGDMINDAIAVWDGGHNVTDSALRAHPCWQWGRDRYATDGLSPLRMWTRGSALTPQGGVDTMIDGTKAKKFVAPWMQNFLLMTLGRGEELGYPTGPIKRWFGANLVSQLTDSAYVPYLAAAYVTPTTAADDSWLSSWAQAKDAYFPAYAGNYTQFTSPSDAEHGYANIALAAASFLKDLPKGPEAWTFMEQKALPDVSLTSNPKWALVPRN